MCRIIIHAEKEIDYNKVGVETSNKLIEDIQKIIPEIPVTIQFIAKKVHED